MLPHDEDLQDADVPFQAVKGLNEASRRARSSGRPVVLVRHGQLIQVSGAETVVLKQLPARRKVTTRRKVL
jgi:hypothetical protein